jgi:hypothetical protein
LRLISFALTTEQIRNRSKTVTRRLGWKDLQPCTLLQPVVKGMGLKKGETVERIGGPIRVVHVQREKLFQMGILHGLDETAREGFPEFASAEFIRMFMAHNACSARDIVTRIQFKYVDREDAQ